MPGRLFCVVGASGSGKDSLMDYARVRLAGHAQIAFVHRYITRPANAGGENHIALSPLEFAARRSAGLFSLDWESNGHCYGVGLEIDAWLARGMTVVVNGSRQHLDHAKTRYPTLAPVWITVSEASLRKRLQARGRESIAEIDARLARHQRAPMPCRDAIVLHNDDELTVAGEALATLLQQSCREPACA